MHMQINLSLDQIQETSATELQKVVNEITSAIDSIRRYLNNFPDEKPEVRQEFNFQICRLETTRKAINLLLIERSLAGMGASPQIQPETIYAA
jgi:molecular chaperone GrpE (heat shock protein)